MSGIPRKGQDRRVRGCGMRVGKGWGVNGKSKQYKGHTVVT